MTNIMLHNLPQTLATETKTLLQLGDDLKGSKIASPRCEMRQRNMK